ncbi:peptide ABC transporter permease [Methyloprofundus sedimenti]|uniref:Peptide ABC transporter permease n=1 Tax=Methyloprofundus sedimenti TaxID=1420851 RepID=A0A1V8MAN0_9GAMM|nr:ABC transporter permease [Methyloprofundus sedimenti]OQK18650.1 peptide ABC transporter permease [Methyloprofundus sedimenti]
MRFSDLISHAYRSVISHKLRSSLTALGLIIGIAAVIILTSIGRGIHTYVLAEFTQFGTNLIAVFPGKTTTLGLSGATISTVRPLTIDDALGIANLDNILATLPLVQGNARIEAGNKQRRTTVLGVGPSVPEVWKINIASGRFLPAHEQANPRAFAVLGHKLAAELFAGRNPLGQRIRIGSDRFRVLGVMEKKGQMMGFDMDDTIYIPTAKALALFDRESVMEIDVLYKSNTAASSIEKSITRLLITRHGGEDFSLITQDQMLKSMDSILNILTLSVAALGGISLLVGSVGILTIMTIAVTERISEIGLLRAVGAEQNTIFMLFLFEALVLSLVGGVIGVGLGILIVQLIGFVVPGLPVQLAWVYIMAAFAVSLLIGLLAGVVPAMKAARLQPLDALRTE